MKRLKFWFQYIVELIKRYWYSIVISFIIGGGVFYLLTNLSPLIAKYFPQTKRIGMVGKYRISNLPPEISHLFSYGLTEILPNSRATGSPIVKNWTVGMEGKEYTFFLKDDIYWQDGDPLKPNQVVYFIEGTEFVYQPNQISIKLDSSFAPLPTLLTQPLIKKKKIGLGEYKIENIKIQAGAISRILLVKNGLEKERLYVNFYPNEENLITAYKLGEIDEARGVTEIEQISNWNNIEIKTDRKRNTNYVAAFFNTRIAPLDNKRVRQGLAYCLEKPEEKDRAISPIAPTSWAYNQDVKAYEYNPAHGKSLLEEGWDPNETIELTITTLPELLNWAERIKKNWQENLNVNLKIKVSRFAPDPNNFEIFLGYGIIPPDPDQYSFWHSTQTENLTGLDNPKIDQLLEKGRKTIDFQERKEVYYEFQRSLSEEIPAIFLYYPENYTLVRK
jgi:peptide/nickel transport system substrate-binding protein